MDLQPKRVSLAIFLEVSLIKPWLRDTEDLRRKTSTTNQQKNISNHASYAM